MKKKTGFSIAGVIIGIIAVALLGVAAYSVIDGNNKATDFNEYDFNTVIGPTKDNGNIGDHVKGNADAPVLIFEYADYQCPGCASVNTKVNKAVEELDGKLGVVYRSCLLPYHQNGTAAASAAGWPYPAVGRNLCRSGYCTGNPGESHPAIAEPVRTPDPSGSEGASGGVDGWTL